MTTLDLDQRKSELNNLALLDCDKVAQNIAFALYSAGKLNRSLRTMRASDIPGTAMLRLASDNGGLSFQVIKGADVLGVDRLTIQDIANMNLRDDDSEKLMPRGVTGMGVAIMFVQDAKSLHPELDSSSVILAYIENPGLDVNSKDELVQAIESLKNEKEEPLPDRPQRKLSPN